MAEIKIVITGAVGAGKTTAIGSISEIPVVSTDVAASDAVSAFKASTTVAMDYGELTLDDGSKLRIYGTPGQERFSFMWDILATGALGFVILVNHSSPTALADLDFYIKRFRKSIDESTMAVGVTHIGDNLSSMAKYYDYMNSQHLPYPIFPVDARKAADVRLMVEAMASMIIYE
ncbi:ATP/GTP-binding protein [Pseudomonas sp. GCM10022188]|uniref:GTP-binding protein n=1 Tax=Pseudomonas TaxID=286 RepID=UPI001E6546D7|nr:ATP/GTP-binding protein [Pseudomonas oryzagri]MCC6074268.1 ATP/GTP-binding protein [Pseudomonas oryzagri]